MDGEGFRLEKPNKTNPYWVYVQFFLGIQSFLESLVNNMIIIIGDVRQGRLADLMQKCG